MSGPVWQPAWDCAAARAALREADPTLRPVLDVPWPPRPARGLFGQLVRAICAQQVSVAAADAVERRLRTACGGEIDPPALLAVSEAELRGAGLSGRKASYVHALAAAAAEGRLDAATLGAREDDEVVALLTALPGIGRWTAEMTLLFALHRPDVWPSSDLGIRAAVGLLDGCGAALPTPRQTAARSQPWSPHRSTAALALWAWRGRLRNRRAGLAE